MEHLNRPLTARSWDSYLNTMYTVLDEIQPKTCFEWGSGLSTQILSMYPSVESVESIEHDKKWFNKTFGSVDKDIVSIKLSELKSYAWVTPKYKIYDFVFVDGRRRCECLKKSRKMVGATGVVMLHDAERHWYDKEVQSFKHYIYTDSGSTVTMTDSDNAYSRIKQVVSNNSI